MNVFQIATLKKILKIHGVKKFEKTVKDYVSLNGDRFMELSDTLFVISRCYEGASSESAKDKMIKANKDWICQVVDNAWCPALLPFTDRYGQDVCKKAIIYLIDHKIWESPVKDQGLRGKTDKIYSHLEDIHLAVEYLNENADEQPPVTEEPVAEVPEPEPQVETPSAEDKLKEPADTDIQYSERCCEEIIVRARALLGVIKLHAQPGLSAKLITELSQKLNDSEGRVKSLETEVSACDKHIDRLKQQLEDSKKEHDKVLCHNDEFDKENKRLTANNNTLADKLKEVTRERDKLKEEVAHIATIPKVRTIPESKARELPLCGDKIVKIWTEFLKKYDVVIDPRK